MEIKTALRNIRDFINRRHWYDNSGEGFEGERGAWMELASLLESSRLDVALAIRSKAAVNVYNLHVFKSLTIQVGRDTYKVI